MRPFVTAGTGFLIAVLWFDLMFDVQVLRSREAELPEAVLGSIAGYYRRVTTTARPMNRLVATVMIATLAAVIAQVARAEHPRGIGWVSIPLLAAPILLAGAHTVPSAVRLGARADGPPEQSRLARAVFRDHVCCLVSLAAVMVLQLSAT